MKRKITAKAQYTTYAEYPLVSGDVRAYEICLDLGENADGAEFKVTAIRADGKVIEDIGKVEGGIATYTMAADMYSVPGELTVRLAVLHESSVLTDREIVFEVLEGASGVKATETVVPINDSVILRLSSIEQKLSEKVDKASGMGLSANDFTDEYKQKLDGFDETVSNEVEKISEDLDNLSDAFDKYKEETDEALGKKINKSDISGVYTFGGSVETLDKLGEALEIKLLPDGDPEYNGVKCGRLEKSTGVLVVDPIYDDALSEIIIPVKEVLLKAGYYAVVSNMKEGKYTSGVWVSGKELDEFCYPEKRVIKIKNDIVITEASIIRHSGSLFYGCEGNVVCTLIKVDERLVDMDSYESYNGSYATGDYEAIEPVVGMVYNVLDTDMNYAWTGTEWDALGGEHKDLEARADIEALETQMGDIESALDSIIEIQNELIGGDGV